MTSPALEMRARTRPSSTSLKSVPGCGGAARCGPGGPQGPHPSMGHRVGRALAGAVEVMISEDYDAPNARRHATAISPEVDSVPEVGCFVACIAAEAGFEASGRLLTFRTAVRRAGRRRCRQRDQASPVRARYQPSPSHPAANRSDERRSDRWHHRRLRQPLPADKCRLDDDSVAPEAQRGRRGVGYAAPRKIQRHGAPECPSGRIPNPTDAVHPAGILGTTRDRN